MLLSRQNIVTCFNDYRRVLDRMSLFVSPHTFTQFGTAGNYSAIAILRTFQFNITHALGFSVFTSRILATDLLQSHCHFKPRMKSLHRLIPFLPFLLSHVRLSSPELDPVLFRLLFGTPSHLLTVLFYNPSAWTPRKTLSSIVKEACLQLRYLAMDDLLLSAFVARMCLRSRCLAMGIHVTIYIHARGTLITSNTILTIYVHSHTSNANYGGDRKATQSVIKLHSCT
jgi:hypothetical protein